jgi:hypothetical protein
MATRLSKPVKRRIGDTIVTLTETHLEIRRIRHLRGVRVALAELVAAADQVRPPRGWIPATGDLVAVLPWRHRARVAMVIPAVPEMLVRISFKRGTERIVELSRLVPVENESVLIQCERTPTNGSSRESDRTLF